MRNRRPTWVDGEVNVEVQCDPVVTGHALEDQVAFLLSQEYERLLGAPAGADLAAVVEDAGLIRDNLCEDALIGLTAACQRLMAWALVAQTQALAELALRWDDPLGPKAQHVSRASVIAEVAAATGLSERAVGARVMVALDVPSRLPQVQASFLAGDLEFVRVKAIVDAVRDLTLEQAALVERDVLAVARRGTMAGLVRALDQAVLTHAPDVADERAQLAAARREVRFASTAHGNALLQVEASATRIAQAEASLNTLTQAALDSTDADDRSVEALRADIVLDLIENAADALTDLPADLPTSTPPPAVEPTDREADPVRPHRRNRRVRGRMQAVVTIPLSTALGLSEDPGYLDGYGPIPAQLARDVAAHGTWRCAVTEDRDGHVHGTLLGLGRTTFTAGYVPKPSTWQYVTARDGTCRFPGCRRAAVHSDLDHRQKYRDGGATCECNLAALCRTHHRLKHGTPLRIDRVDDDGTHWIGRTGRRYTVPHQVLPHAPVPTDRPEPPGGHDTGDPPPF